MMATIRIDDEVFEMLKQLAEPFVDTPNTVIRRLLEGQGGAQSKQVDVEARPVASKAKAKRGSRTPQATYETFLLHVLGTKFKGRANKDEASTAVIEMMEARGLLEAAAHEMVSTGETKAENTVAWARNALKDRGLLSHQSPRGTWELTPEGIKAAREVVLPPSDK